MFSIKYKNPWWTKVVVAIKKEFGLGSKWFPKNILLFTVGNIYTENTPPL
jgi:hypothetical protein